MIRINSDFEGGAIEVVEASNASNIKLNIAKDNQSCTRQWFYFSVESPLGETHNIQILNANKVTFSSAWEGYQVFASQDNDNWSRVDTSFDGNSLSFNNQPGSDITYYAYFVPYTLTRQQSFIEVMSKHSFADVETLTKTPLGNSVELLTLGNYDVTKKNVWVIARQHPGETMAQWIAQGLISALCEYYKLSGSENSFNVFVVFNMNPDGSMIGNHRTNALGQNLNRCWASPSIEQCPEVYYVQRAMNDYGVDFFIDIHGDEEIPFNFIMGKSDDDSASKFKSLLAKSEPRFQLEYDYDSYKSAEQTSCCSSGCGNGQTATNYVATAFGATSLLLEASFKALQNRPESETWDHLGCAEFGKIIAHTLVAFMDKNA